jgi:xanthine dehydrogenase YagT iron-sulfur-binding subunit
MDKAKRPLGLNRRAFMTASASAAAAPLVLSATARSAGRAAGPGKAAEAVTVDLVVNGKPCRLELDPRTTLLDALRDHVGLTGTKKGCDHGQCGACTVLANGRRILSCMSFAHMNDGDEITTIEGLTADGRLHPVQQAFIDFDAFQCGYCTPGQIMSAVACIKEGHATTDEDIREYMSGNICRCAAYPNIVAAIRQARDEMERS